MGFSPWLFRQTFQGHFSVKVNILMRTDRNSFQANCHCCVKAIKKRLLNKIFDAIEDKKWGWSSTTRHKNSGQVIVARVYVTILSSSTHPLTPFKILCANQNNLEPSESVTNLLSLLPSTKKMPSSGRLVTGCRLTITMLLVLLVVVVPPLTTATKFLTQFLTWYFHARTITEPRRDALMMRLGVGVVMVVVVVVKWLMIWWVTRCW